MTYYVKDAYGSTLGIESSVVTTGERQVVAIGSVLVPLTVTSSGNQSISGTTGASIIGVGMRNTADGDSAQVGLVTSSNNRVFNGSSWDRMRGDTVGVYVVPQGSVIATGSVAVLQGTNPWTVGPSSVQLISTSASIATQVNRILQGNSSVQLITGIGVIGSVAALQGTNPWVIGNSSVQVNNIATGNTSVQLISTSASIATQVNRILQGNSSVQLITGIGVIGSVATLQGTNPWITTVQANSIAGTYAEDAAHVDGQRGIFVLGVRNDNIASFASANIDYTPFATDSAGRGLVKPFAAEEARVQSVIATNNTTSTSLLAAAGAGLRNYITDAIVTNTGSVTTTVNFLDGDNSVIGATIAPAGGGSNIVGLATPMRTGGFNQIVHVTAGTAVSTLGVTALGYKAP